MLKFAALSDSSGSYFLADRAREVTDLFERRGPGVWSGAAAERFGLCGVVTDDDLAAVLSGRPLGATLSPHPQRRRVGYDLTFAAPKPVSVLFAFEADAAARRIVNAHEHGVAVALSYLEDRGAVVNRSLAAGRVGLRTEGLLCATFTHGLSRSHDPHLHSHLVVANLARDEQGRFGSLDARVLRAHAPTADALYRAQLRFELSRDLGVSWQRGSDGHERIEGVADAVSWAMSGRSADVRSGERSRPAKEQAASRHDLEALWHERRRRAPQVTDLERTNVASRALDEHRFASMLYDHARPARTVVEAFAEAAGGGVEGSLARRNVVRLGVELGHGLAERPLSPREVIPSQRALRLLGARPTSRGPLESWWRRSETVERSREPLRVIAHERAAHDPFVR